MHAQDNLSSKRPPAERAHASHRVRRLALSTAVLWLIPCAFGQGLTITLNNNTSRSIKVTVYDENARPRRPLLSGDVINGFATITVSVTADPSGQGHISWSAITVDDDMRRCGHRDKAGLDDGATVHVFASDACGGS